ncbi:hypothetical protein PB01_00835 [Psychrobacillus glaciei]|uniref:Uncharacterized protein n=1 Tax=Psychrobacillus glaciei TaxID=2283160 RepID=A0A5J6SIQ4_9BACI|nr:hypothetical protein PB01_00835 [Psychrobacillus glaciei]
MLRPKETGGIILKKYIQFIGFLVIILYGCAPDPVKIEEESFETIDEPKTVEKQEIMNDESELVKSQFVPMLEAVNNNNEEGFLEFQNSENSLFYKEQKRWIEEAVFKKQQGYTFSVNIGEVNLMSSDKGIIELIVNMKYQDKGTQNKVIYSIVKLKNKWVIDDVPFKKISEGNIAVLYVSDMEEQALTVLREASDIVHLYNNEFGWDPKDVTIKLYDSREQVSATIPWIGLTGWNETGESLKLMIEPSASYSTLAHELGHNMLSDFSNDNVSLYIQEGFATLLEHVVEKDADGKPVINLNNLPYREQKLLSNRDLVFLSIDDLNKLDYNNTFGIYGLGFLLTDYLIKTQGFDKFMTMVKELMNEPYIDSRSEHKLQILSERTTKAIEKVYGSTDQLSDGYINYFTKKN